MKLSKEELLDLFEEMVLIREFERKIYEFATTGIVSGSVHLCIGEEAAAVGTVKSMGPDDYLLPTHRGHGQGLAGGTDPKNFLQRYLAKKVVYAKEESVQCISLIKNIIVSELKGF